MSPGLFSAVVDRVADPPRDRGSGVSPAATPPAQKGRPKSLLVIGNGMVSHRLCQELVRLGLHETLAITVIGEEKVPAYDRVNLARVLRGETVESLVLDTTDWYLEHGIELRLGAPVVEVDADARAVVTKTGRERFDIIVFATGSSPVVPRLAGVDAPEVSVYRSERDARRLRALARNGAHPELPALVLGAGLLGLEAAAELDALGRKVHLVESSSQLLPRQLDEATAARVETAVTRAGHRLHKGVRVERLVTGQRALRVELDDGSSLLVAMVVLAMGVRPRDDVARRAGLVCDLFGGVVVDDGLATSKPGIFAIGECVRHRQVSYGIVAPGYQMAEVLAQRLLGHDVRFSGATMTTRLKRAEVAVCAVGESTVSDLATLHCVHEDGLGYRRLVVRRGRLIGLSVVGDWDELHLAQQAVLSKRKLGRRQLERFARGEPLFDRAAVDLRTWPADAPVCACTGVTCGALRAAHGRGAASVEELTRRTGAGGVCGSCKPLLAALCEETATVLDAQPPPTLTLAAAAVALVLSAAALLGPAIPYPTSVQVLVPWDELWRSSLVKQLTGYALVGTTLLGLALSVRRRLGGLRRFEDSSLRMFHVVMGAVVLVVFASHTGFRPGANWDWALGTTFAGSALIGAVTAFGTTIERRLRGGSGARLRRAATRLHLWLVWPLPALVLTHVIKVYFF